MKIPFYLSHEEVKTIVLVLTSFLGNNQKKVIMDGFSIEKIENRMEDYEMIFQVDVEKPKER